MPPGGRDVVVGDGGDDGPATLGCEPFTVLPLAGDTQLVAGAIHGLPEVDSCSHLCNFTTSSSQPAAETTPRDCMTSVTQPVRVYSVTLWAGMKDSCSGWSLIQTAITWQPPM